MSSEAARWPLWRVGSVEEMREDYWCQDPRTTMEQIRRHQRRMRSRGRRGPGKAGRGGTSSRGGNGGRLEANFESLDQFYESDASPNHSPSHGADSRQAVDGISAKEAALLAAPSAMHARAFQLGVDEKDAGWDVDHVLVKHPAYTDDTDTYWTIVAWLCADDNDGKALFRAVGPQGQTRDFSIEEVTDAVIASVDVDDGDEDGASSTHEKKHSPQGSKLTAYETNVRRATGTMLSIPSRTTRSGIRQIGGDEEGGDDDVRIDETEDLTCNEMAETYNADENIYPSKLTPDGKKSCPPGRKACPICDAHVPSAKRNCPCGHVFSRKFRTPNAILYVPQEPVGAGTHGDVYVCANQSCSRVVEFLHARGATRPRNAARRDTDTGKVLCIECFSSMSTNARSSRRQASLKPIVDIAPKKRKPRYTDVITDFTKYCICRKPYNPNGPFMIECDKCNDWFHGRCVGISAHEAKKLVSYTCPKCRGDIAGCRDIKWEVEDVLDVRYNDDGEAELLVSWAGWPSDYDGWEPASNFDECDELLQQFEQSHPELMRERKMDADVTAADDEGEYERKRKENVRRNQEFLKQLGMDSDGEDRNVEMGNADTDSSHA